MERIVVITVLLFALHVVILAYIYQTRAPEETAENAEAKRSDSFTRSWNPTSNDSPNRFGSAGGVNSTKVPCQICGVPNDPAFRFCRNCISPLSNGNAAYGEPPVGRSSG